MTFFGSKSLPWFWAPRRYREWNPIVSLLFTVEVCEIPMMHDVVCIPSTIVRKKTKPAFCLKLCTGVFKPGRASPTVFGTRLGAYRR